MVHQVNGNGRNRQGLMPNRVGQVGERRSACDRSFDVCEIAEIIFLKLSMGDLLCGAQQVCQQWKEVIGASCRLQETLFFKPIVESPVHFIQQVCPVPKRSYWMTAHRPWLEVPVIEHPYLYMLSLDMDSDSEVFWRAEASWRRQLLTQPPLRVAQVTSSEDSGVVGYVSGDGQGVRMGDVAMRGEFYSIHGWSDWDHFRNHQQLQQLKDDLLELIRTQQEGTASDTEAQFDLTTLFGDPSVDD